MHTATVHYQGLSHAVAAGEEHLEEVAEFFASTLLDHRAHLLATQSHEELRVVFHPSAGPHRRPDWPPHPGQPVTVHLWLSHDELVRSPIPRTLWRRVLDHLESRRGHAYSDRDQLAAEEWQRVTYPI